MRKRINISIDPASFDELTKVQKQFGFATLCEMLEALTHIMTDHMNKPEDRIFDLNDDDNAVIDGMFDDLHKKAAAPKPPAPGRPKKAKPAEAAPKKVGRPKKAATAAADTASTTPATQRKVGRPKKEQTEAAAPPIKRKVGRPRKTPAEG